MLKLNASYSKKVPGQEEYSSEGYLCSVELELSDTLELQELQHRIHDTFALVKASVESELNHLRGRKELAGGQRRNELPEHRSTRGGNPNGKATNRQLHYLTSLASERGIALSQLNSDVASRFGVRDLYGLSKRQASLLVDELKAAA